MKLVFRRFRLSIGADCMDCPWETFDNCARELAKRHARETGHSVYFTTEDTTIYRGNNDAKQ